MVTVANVENKTGTVLYDRVTVATWKRELGEAYYSRSDYLNAEKYLRESLEIVYYRFPNSSLKFHLKTNRELSKRVKYDILFNRPNKSEVKDGSKFFKDNIGSLSVLMKKLKLPVMHHVRLALVTLSQLFQQQGLLFHWRLASILGLNISEQFPKDGLYATFLSMAASAIYTLDMNNTTTLKYLQIAGQFDRRIDISSGIVVASCTATTLFLDGQWLKALIEIDSLQQLGAISGDFGRREEAYRLRSMIYLYSGQIGQAATLGKELSVMSAYEEHWLGKFYGALITLQSLLTSTSNADEISSSMEALNAIIRSSDSKIFSSATCINLEAVLAQADLHLGGEIDISQVLNKNIKSLRSIRQHHWISIFGIIQFTDFIEHANSKGLMEKSTIKRDVKNFCSEAELALKRISPNRLSEVSLLLLKGVHDIVASKNYSSAIQKWKKSLALPGTEEIIYVRGILHARIAKYGTKIEDKEFHSKQALNIFKKMGNSWEIEKLTG